MSEMGEEYVGTYAEVVGTDEDIHASGGTGSGEGGTTGVWWLLWSYTVVGTSVTGGFTGTNWGWELSGNYLRESFEKSEYYSQYEGESLSRFQQYLAQYKPQSLNDFLSTWPQQDKADFVNTYLIHNEQYKGCVVVR